MWAGHIIDRYKWAITAHDGIGAIHAVVIIEYRRNIVSCYQRVLRLDFKSISNWCIYAELAYAIISWFSSIWAKYTQIVNIKFFTRDIIWRIRCKAIFVIIAQMTPPTFGRKFINIFECFSIAVCRNILLWRAVSLIAHFWFDTSNIHQYLSLPFEASLTNFKARVKWAISFHQIFSFFSHRFQLYYLYEGKWRMTHSDFLYEIKFGKNFSCHDQAFKFLSSSSLFSEIHYAIVTEL